MDLTFTLPALVTPPLTALWLSELATVTAMPVPRLVSNSELSDWPGINSPVKLTSTFVVSAMSEGMTKV